MTNTKTPAAPVTVRGYEDESITWDRCLRCGAKRGEPCHTSKGRSTSRIHNGRATAPKTVDRIAFDIDEDRFGPQD